MTDVDIAPGGTTHLAEAQARSTALYLAHTTCIRTRTPFPYTYVIVVPISHTPHSLLNHHPTKPLTHRIQPSLCRFIRSLRSLTTRSPVLLLLLLRAADADAGAMAPPIPAGDACVLTPSTCVCICVLPFDLKRAMYRRNSFLTIIAPTTDPRMVGMPRIRARSHGERKMGSTRARSERGRKAIKAAQPAGRSSSGLGLPPLPLPTLPYGYWGDVAPSGEERESEGNGLTNIREGRVERVDSETDRSSPPPLTRSLPDCVGWRKEEEEGMPRPIPGAAFDVEARGPRDAMGDVGPDDILLPVP